MARRTSRIDGTVLVHQDGNLPNIVVGSPDWYVWLEGASTFRFTCAQGSFSARKERKGSTGWYWKAYRKQAGRLYRVYLGKSPDLSLDRLITVAAELAHRLEDSRPAVSTAIGGSDPPTDGAASTAQDRQPVPSAVGPILATKLYIPAPRTEFVPRPRLVERLQDGIGGKLTLVAAPAGSGKTTLISAWFSQSSGDAPPLAWVSLDREDNDPARFWTYAIAALETVYPDVGANALALLRSPQPPPLDVILISLINALSPLLPNAVLALDDYHLIDTPTIHTSLTFLLGHLPPHLHLILLTRADPPLPLTRLRARGQLTELRAADLRFTTDETASFLTRLMALPLSDGEVAALQERTEGWIAGLHLAALAMRDLTDRAGFITAFTGSHRFVVDYLVEEVFTSQPRHIQTFLLQTAILDKMCGSLCDAMLELDPESRNPEPQSAQAYSQRILEQLEHANLFIMPLDDVRHWYRYHQLFAEVLRARMEAGARPADVRVLHRRASAWYEQHGLVAEAVHHALAAGAEEDAARLVEEHGLMLILQGYRSRVLGWMEALPDAVIRSRPDLCIIHTSVLVLNNQLAAAEMRLQDAEDGIRADMPPEQIQIIRGRVAQGHADLARYHGDLKRYITLSGQVLRTVPESDALGRAAAMMHLSRGYLVTGQLTAEIEQQVAAVIEPARTSGNVLAWLIALLNLAQVRALRGRLRQAAATYQVALAVTPSADTFQHLYGSAAYYVGMGDISCEWNDLDAAEQHLTQARELARGEQLVDPDVILRGYIALARLRLAQGDDSGALATVDEFLDLAQRRAFFHGLCQQARAARTRICLAQGDVVAATGWANTCELQTDDAASYLREYEHLTLARVWIAQRRNDGRSGEIDHVLHSLERLAATAEQSERLGSVIEIMLLRALALDSQGRSEGALRELKRALNLAKPEGYVRIFVDEGAPMAALLARIVGTESPVAAYAAKLLEVFPNKEVPGSSGPQPTALVEPLSVRELEVLRLIADGHSNQAIADILIIAVSTVKRHINNIYGKLEVQSRTQALLRARELNML